MFLNFVNSTCVTAVPLLLLPMRGKMSVVIAKRAYVCELHGQCFFVIHFLVSIQRSTFVYKMLLVKFVALRTGMRK